ncbi:RNA polymerase Rpb1 domain 5 family protein (apicoplast) [Babesia bovis T2Bo]|uniref:DNA-directed RNA polymerase n=1 Tax=Babesia bovis TaxID=5865 RepID=A7AXE3_BABBO|nr:RNA polymerase Rpb1 domain 5 family protein [Babesia bovis T2Bo]EDO05066.1 RNA polymerase Rpb1 domain 5 family protein [Babesia bovis T2Bo]|eukprot:YP_002290846.1 rpoC2-N-terminal (apicoplast) [Babesia bovis T2Bo]
MPNKINKTLKLLSIVELSHLEKHLQELVNISFEYSSIFPFNYNLNSFKFTPLYNIHISTKNIHNFNYLLNLYIEKDNFMSMLFCFTKLKAKLTLNQLLQILTIKGTSSITENCTYLLSNLYYGLNLKDFIYSSFSARNSIIDSSLNTAESGYLTRRLIESLRNVYIKNLYCKTLYKCINYKKNNKQINIPFLCLNNKSVCLKCSDLDYKDISLSGYCKGTISAQALGEPSTQMLLRTFHLGDKPALNSLATEVMYDTSYVEAVFEPLKLDYFAIINVNYNNLSVSNLLFNTYYLHKNNIFNIASTMCFSFAFINCIKILNNVWCMIDCYNKTFNKNITPAKYVKNLFKIKKYFLI